TTPEPDPRCLIGASLAGWLLLNSDRGTGSSFDISDNGGEPTPTPTPETTPTATPTPDPTPTPAPAPASNNGRFEERYSGTINPGQAAVTLSFDVRRSTLDSQINQNYGNQQLYFELLDGAGNVVTTATQQKINREDLSPGRYSY